MTNILHREADHSLMDAGPPQEMPAVRVSGRAGDAALHRIVVVGGGAGGLELVTRLGNRLGRRGQASVTLVECARTHIWKPLLHGVAAGSIDPEAYEVNYLAQAHWHGFRYRLGEMVGLDRTRKEVSNSAPRSMTKGARSRHHARSVTTRW